MKHIINVKPGDDRIFTIGKNTLIKLDKVQYNKDMGNKDYNQVRITNNVLRTHSDSVYQYFTFEALEDNSTVYLFKNASPTIERTIDLKYSLDNGQTWSEYTIPEAGQNGASISFNTGDKILFKGNNPDGFNECYFEENKNQKSYTDSEGSEVNKFSIYFLGTGTYKITGNAMSLVYNDNFADKRYFPNRGCFGRLFFNNNALKEIDKLCLGGPYKNQPEVGYLTFYRCSNLETASFELLPSSLTGMFFYCRKLKKFYYDWDAAHITSLYYAFLICDALEYIGDMKNIDTTDLSNISDFLNMGGLNLVNTKLSQILDVSKWDTSKVHSMASVFCGRAGLKVTGLSNWDVSKSVTMRYMFHGCRSLLDTNFENWKLLCNDETRGDLERAFDDMAGYRRVTGHSIKEIECLMELPEKTDLWETFCYAYDLTTIKKAMPIRTTDDNIPFGYCPLTHDSAMVLINALVEGANNTLELSAYTYDLLTADEIAIATNKGWTIARK